MAIGANSYSSVAEVAALTPQFTASGSFSTATRPTTAQVEAFIDRVSAIVNVLLAEEGFSIPISQADAKLALDHFVVEEVADLVESANMAGRFYMDEGELRSRGRFRVIMGDAEQFISEHSEGIQSLGATRDRSLTYGLSYWATDDAGDEIEPIFSRKMMRQSIVDWDEE